MPTSRPSSPGSSPAPSKTRSVAGPHTARARPDSPWSGLFSCIAVIGALLAPAASRAAEPGACPPAAQAPEPAPLAASATPDGRLCLVIAHDGHLRLLARDGAPAPTLPPFTDDRGRPARFAAALTHGARKSFLVLRSDEAELWELSYDPGAAPVYRGLVHDYRMGEALATPGWMAPRVTRLSGAVAEFAILPQPGHWMGLSADGRALDVYQLDVRRPVAHLALPVAVRLAGWRSIVAGDRPRLLLHRLDGGTLAIDPVHWRVEE